MIEVVTPPKWMAWLDSGIGLPPEPPVHSGGGWRPDWDWTEVLLGLYLAWLAFNVIQDVMKLRGMQNAG